jgi:hypothetical protein
LKTMVATDNFAKVLPAFLNMNNVGSLGSRKGLWHQGERRHLKKNLKVTKLLVGQPA